MNKKCQNKNCNSSAISFSKHCGEHTSQKELKLIVQKLKQQSKICNLSWSLVSIKNKVW